MIIIERKNQKNDDQTTVIMHSNQNILWILWTEQNSVKIVYVYLFSYK